MRISYSISDIIHKLDVSFIEFAEMSVNEIFTRLSEIDSSDETSDISG